jgi:hypothetical protein
MRISYSTRVGVRAVEDPVVDQEAVAAADLVVDRAMGVLDLGPDQARLQELDQRQGQDQTRVKDRGQVKGMDLATEQATKVKALKTVQVLGRVKPKVSIL